MQLDATPMFFYSPQFRCDSVIFRKTNSQIFCAWDPARGERPRWRGVGGCRHEAPLCRRSEAPKSHCDVAQGTQAFDTVMTVAGTILFAHERTTGSGAVVAIRR